MTAISWKGHVKQVRFNSGMKEWSDGWWKR